MQLVFEMCVSLFFLLLSFSVCIALMVLGKKGCTNVVTTTCGEKSISALPLRSFDWREMGFCFFVIFHIYCRHIQSAAAGRFNSIVISKNTGELDARWVRKESPNFERVKEREIKVRKRTTPHRTWWCRYFFESLRLLYFFSFFCLFCRAPTQLQRLARESESAEQRKSNNNRANGCTNTL